MASFDPFTNALLMGIYQPEMEQVQPMPFGPISMPNPPMQAAQDQGGMGMGLGDILGMAMRGQQQTSGTTGAGTASTGGILPKSPLTMEGPAGPITMGGAWGGSDLGMFMGGGLP